MNYLLLLISLFFCNTEKSLKEEIIIEKIVIYKNFYKAGTTSLLKNIFISPLDYKVETSFIHVKNEDVNIFEFILNNTAIKKHKQIKINVDMALIIIIQGKEHFFVIAKSNNMIIDLTANLNYKLNSNILKNKVTKFIKKYS